VNYRLLSNVCYIETQKVIVIHIQMMNCT